VCSLSFNFFKIDFLNVHEIFRKVFCVASFDLFKVNLLKVHEIVKVVLAPVSPRFSHF
jgi:hypothetical protein